MNIGTPVLPAYQDEVLHLQGSHGKLSSTCTFNSSGQPDNQTIHAIRKFLQANARAIYIHLGGGILGHLGLIISDASYVMIAPKTAAGPKLGQDHKPLGGSHPTRMEQRSRIVPHVTCGRRTFKLTGRAPPCNRRCRSKSSVFLGRCIWTS
jgi:hypothetical protein